MNRRGFLTGIIAACVAPAIIRTSGLIMPIKPALVTHPFEIWEYDGPIEIGVIENFRFVESVTLRQWGSVLVIHPEFERFLKDDQYDGRYVVSRPLPQFEEKMMS